MILPNRWPAVLSLLPLLVLASNPAAAQRVKEGPVETTPLRGGIYMMAMGTAGNVGVSVGDDGAFIIDDQFAEMADRLKTAVGELTDKPIKYVLNTHWHGDHSGSNANFGRSGYTIVAHENVRARLSSVQYDLMVKTGTRPHPQEALPVITYSDRMTFYFNDDIIDVIHLPPGHTDGDSAFYFREANVLHSGDAFMNRGYPKIDVTSGGTIKGNIEAIDVMLGMIDDDTIVLPGHGPLADKVRMIAMRDMLVEARARVVELIDKGLSLKEIKDAKPLAPLDPKWSEGLLKGRAFTTLIYQGETGDWEMPDEITRWAN